MFAAADQDVGLDADFAELTDRVLRRFGFQFVGGLQVGDERQVHEEHVIASDVLGVLANRFQERKALDVADGSADFGDHDVDVVAAHPRNHGFDFVGDVRDDLDGLAKEAAFAFFFDDGQIDLAGRVVAVTRQRAAGETLVVPEVQIRFTAVVEHIDFAMLIGAHRPRVDVDIGIQLLHANAQSTRFEQHSQGGACQAFSE